MTILIVGSEGFIGSHLVQYFAQKNFNIIEADIKAIQKQNYIQLNPYEPEYDAIFSNNRIDVCINASGSANVKFSFAQPKIDFDSNTMTVFRILNAIKNNASNCKFINLSSAAVYGNYSNKPLNEKLPCNPVSPYGFHKWYAELICKEYALLFNIKCCSARLFSVYGERQEKLLFWDMWQKYLLNNNTVELFGTGNEARDFMYVKDVAKALWYVIQNNNFTGDAINIATGLTTTIKDVAHIFFKQIDTHTQYKFTHTTKLGDPDVLAADITELANYGFTATYSLEEGLKSYTQWLQEKK